jgi:hypothetical protein
MNSRRLMLAPLMTEHRTGKNYRAGRGNIRFGSKADIYYFLTKRIITIRKIMPSTTSDKTSNEPSPRPPS